MARSNLLSDALIWKMLKYTSEFIVEAFYAKVKDCLPYLFHSFRNKYFNKILLGNMLYFQNKLYKF